MGVNRLPQTVTRQRRGCDLNPGPSAPESSTLQLGYRATHTTLQYIINRSFSNISVSEVIRQHMQGVLGFFYNRFTANLLECQPVKEFLKSAKI